MVFDGEMLGQDTGARDAKIARAARRTGDLRPPTVAMGGFDWSRTTQLFKQVGGYRDPRVGRGQHGPCPSSLRALGWPFDQLFVSPALTSGRFACWGGRRIDYGPLAASLCLAPGEIASRW